MGREDSGTLEKVVVGLGLGRVVIVDIIVNILVVVVDAHGNIGDMKVRSEREAVRGRWA